MIDGTCRRRRRVHQRLPAEGAQVSAGDVGRSRPRPHRFGERALAALRRRRPRRRARRVREHRRAERLREEHAAPGPGRAARADAGRRRCRRRRRASAGPGSAAYMPQKDLLLPWRRALGNAMLGAEIDGVPRGRRPGRGPLRAVRAVRPGRLRAGVAAELSGGMRQRLALLRTFLFRRDVLAARRAVRRARRDHPAGHVTLAAGGVAGRPADRAVRHPRRRGGAVAVRPGRGDVGPARDDHRLDRGARSSGPDRPSW